MNKNWIKSYWGNCLSIVAIICSIVAICVSLPSTQGLGIDYIGVIVGILSLLVTILIGWQIYNVITIEKKIKEETVSLKEQINNSLTNENRKRDLRSMYVLEITHARISLIEKDYEDAFAWFMAALDKANKIDESKNLTEATLSKFHEMIIDVTAKNIQIPIDSKQKDKYIDILRQIKDKRAIDLINYIYSRF